MNLNTVKLVGRDLGQFFHSDRFEYKNWEDQTPINTLFFEITNICNAKCIFCAYKTATHKKGVMSFEIFKKAIDEYVEMGGGNVSFTPTVGDPLIDPGLLEKIAYAVRLPNIKNVYFYTNGILLGHNDLYRKLIDSGIKAINVSTAGANKEMFEQVYGVKSYDQVISGLHSLLKYNAEQGEKVRIGINFRQSSTKEEVLNSPDFITYIKPYLSGKVSYSFMEDYDNWGGMIKQEHLLGTMKLRYVPKIKKLPCIRTFDMAVLFDGSLRVCACRMRLTEFDELVVGNILSESLASVYYGPKVKGLRQGFCENKLTPTCKDCSVYVPATKKLLRDHVMANDPGE